MGRVLTAATSATCPHGGQVVFVPSHSRASVDGSPVLTSATVALVVGCPHTEGSVPKPCLTVSWSAPSGRVTSAGSPVLLDTSVGTCRGAASSPQGRLVLADAQSRVHAL